MKRRPLPSQAQLQELFDYKDGNLIRKQTTAHNARKGDVAGYVSHDYFVVGIGKTKYMVHRLIWKLIYGTEPEVIDHINRNSLDNRIENLREASPALNGINRVVKGAYKRSDCSTYIACYSFNGVRNYLGSFTTEAEARAAYEAAHAKHFEQFSPYANA